MISHKKNKIDVDLNEYRENEVIITQNGLNFSKAHTLRLRYIPMQYHEQVMKLLKELQFQPYSNERTIPHEKGYVSPFNNVGRRYHVIIRYKYFKIGNITMFYFWIKVHQDLENTNGHAEKRRGFKCPFCNHIVRSQYQYGEHFSNGHVF